MKPILTFAFLAIVALGIILIALAHGTLSAISALVASAPSNLTTPEYI